MGIVTVLELVVLLTNMVVVEDISSMVGDTKEIDLTSQLEAVTRVNSTMLQGATTVVLFSIVIEPLTVLVWGVMYIALARLFQAREIVIVVVMCL